VARARPLCEAAAGGRLFAKAVSRVFVGHRRLQAASNGWTAVSLASRVS
jgi:hypothetical protein